MEVYVDTARQALRDNGGTFDLYGYVVHNERGYMVGGVATAPIVPVTGVATLAAVLGDFVADFRRTRADRGQGTEGLYLGTWVHDGKVYVDISEWVGCVRQATALAQERGELAIWDCYHGNEINTGD